MGDVADPKTLYAHCLDVLFAQAVAQEAAPAVLSLPLRREAAQAQAPAEPQPAPALPEDWPGSPPRLESGADLLAAHAWLRFERARLEQYTRSQFDQLQSKHNDILGRYYRNEAELTMRVQEVNREMQFLAAQAQALRERARGLAEWEEALRAQAASLARLHHYYEAARPGEADAAAGQALRAALEGLRQLTSVRQLSEVAAQAKFEAVEARLREHREVWEKKQAEVLARQTEVERRYGNLERAEAALQRRLAEVDELEKRLLQEYGQGPSPRAVREAELDRRFHDLEQAEVALQRRLAEVEELERRLDQERDEDGGGPVLDRPARRPYNAQALYRGP
jgi:hypothetical protein